MSWEDVVMSLVELEAVDRVEITILIDNVTDPLLVLSLIHI